MTTYKPLDEKHRSAIMRLVSVACEMAESDRSLKKVAIRLIKFAAWRWTADAFDSEKAEVKIDAIKFSFDHIHHTRESLGTADRNEGLIHEHIVPLGKLAERALKLGSSRPDALRKLFEDNCRAALITCKQDKTLNDHKLRDSMPDRWEWGDDPLARYHACNLKLLPPRVEE